MPGDELYRIADLSTVWVIAEVAERDIGCYRHRGPGDRYLSGLFQSADGRAGDAGSIPS